MVYIQPIRGPTNRRSNNKKRSRKIYNNQKNKNT